MESKSSSEQSSRPVHLLCLMHGMWGNPNHLAEASRTIEEKVEALADGSGVEFAVLVAKANQNGSTYDGIDWGGERIADEIREHIEQLERDSRKVVKFSVLGYSLGGLLGRYVIGILQSRKFFDSVEPVNFTTIATPHIGLPRYPSIWSSLTNKLGPTLLSRTGEQFFAVDKWGNTEKPLLEVMATPGTIFIEALQRFPNISIYANAVNDLTVPYITASINEDDPFANHVARGIEVEYIESYKPIVASIHEPDTPPPKPKSPTPFTRAWFRAIKDLRPPLPPFLQRPFPMNLVLYAALPVLFPTFLCLVLVRLTLDSRASRARIRLLEEDGEGRLITLLRSLEKEMDDAVADLVDAPGRSLLDHEAENNITNNAEREPKEKRSKWGGSKSKPYPEDRSKYTPRLKPSQRLMVRSLNGNLKQMKKFAAFIHPIRNAHGTIISRDVKNFDFHREGEGVLRHWADSFVF